MKLMVIQEFDRNKFEIVISRHKRVIKELEEKKTKGLIGENDYLFTLDDVIAICQEVARGFWDNCSKQENPKSKWSREVRGRKIRLYIKEAFVIKARK